MPEEPEPSAAAPTPTTATAPAPEPRDVRSALPVPPLRRFESAHEIVVSGQRVAFTAVAGDTRIHDDNGEPIASMFSFAYLREARDDAQRPVVFVTGGGPGAGSDTVQVGAFGPWVVPADRLDPSTAAPPVAPYPYVDNERCLLDVADLVFIDPIGTGWSRAVGHGRGSDFWSVDADAGSIAAFIQQWLSTNGRWDSPKFFAGSSYGGSRATFVADALMGGPTYQGLLRGVALNGIISLVNGLGMPVGFAGMGEAAWSASTLPAMAATAWYHSRVERGSRSVEEYFDEVCDFALGDYLTALKGHAAGIIDADLKAAVAARAAGYVGLPVEAFEGGLVLSPFTYARIALGDGGRTVGVYDGRYTLARPGPDMVADDAVLSRAFTVGAGTFANVAHQKLGIQIDEPYVSVGFRTAYAGWSYQHGPSIIGEFDESGTAADHAAVLMNRNESLHLFVGNGRYDLIAPPARYATARSDIPKERLTLREYNTGHDIHDEPGRGELLDDLREFVLKASGR